MSKAVKYTFIYRFTYLLTGILITISIPLVLTLEEQGFYFTFASIVALQVFFELGLSQVLQIKFANLSGSECEKSKLRQLLYIGRIYYRILSILFFIFTFISGVIFFDDIYQNNFKIILIWFFLVLSTSINLLNNVKLTYIEGIGKLFAVSKVRILGNLLGSLIFLLFAYFGYGLWIVISIPVGNALAFTSWLYLHNESNDYRISRINRNINFLKAIQIWKNDIFSMQWRISLSWICGYFIFQLLVPIIFKNFGPEEAGRIGFSNNILFTINSISCTFCVAKTPLFSKIFANKNYKKLISLFKSSLIKSLLSTFLGLVLAILFINSTQSFFPNFVNRFANNFQLIIISINSFLFSISLCLSVFLRCQGKEPLLKITTVVALMKLPILILLGNFSTNYLLIGNLFIDFIGIIGIIIIFKNNLKLLLEKNSV